MNGIDVIGLGAMNVDQLYYVERILGDGEGPVKEFGLAAGGSAANTIYGLAKLGVSAGFVGVVGDDEMGKILLKDFIEAGVDSSQIRVEKGARTGSVLCLSDEQGRRSLYVMPGANSLLSRQDIDLEYLKQAKILHLSSFVDEQQLEVQRQLLNSLPPDVKVSFAPGNLLAAKGLSFLASLLERTHILFLNRDELRQLAGEDLVSGAKKSLKQGCQVVVITLGEGAGIQEGKRLSCYIVDAKKEYKVEVQSKPIILGGDTIGAGDAFAAGFIYGFLKEKNPGECGILGDIMAHGCLTKRGARAGLPSLRELAWSYQERRGKPL